MIAEKSEISEKEHQRSRKPQILACLQRNLGNGCREMIKTLANILKSQRWEPYLTGERKGTNYVPKNSLTMAAEPRMVIMSLAAVLEAISTLFLL